MAKAQVTDVNTVWVTLRERKRRCAWADGVEVVTAMLLCRCAVSIG